MIPISQLSPSDWVRIDGEWTYVNIRQAPFALSGVTWDDALGQYTRIPSPWRETMTEAVQGLALNTSGGCVRFFSDARRLALRVTLVNPEYYDHMPATGVIGMDVYYRQENRWAYVGTARTGMTSPVYTFSWSSDGPAQWLLNMPLYCGVRSVEVGFPADSSVDAPQPWSIQNPLVFYGSSITQGGCASRPGNQYSAYLSRWFDVPQHNLGFSGSAHAEPEVARYIATLPMSAFIMDYDHNDRPSDLVQRHGPFFDIVRAAQPEVPIILLSRSDVDCMREDTPFARHIIADTWHRALAAGDRNVYFVDGRTMFGVYDRDACTVDAVHPNDLGFYRMAEGLRTVLTEILGRPRG